MAETSLWNKSQLKFGEQRHYRHFPAEFLLRSVLSSAYFANVNPIEAGQKVLDIGCLYANNLIPFADRGCLAYGVEVTDDAVEIARETARQQGLDSHIERGTNTSLPFDDEFFDFLLSINTIHYEESKANVIAGLTEFRRVLKPGGCLVIASAGQEHDFVKTAQKRGPNSYIARFRNDFRNDQTFSFFDSREDFEKTLSSVFDTVEIAVTTETYPCTNLQFYVGKCFR
jgi:SAM-dependent methyltransferase